MGTVAVEMHHRGLGKGQRLTKRLLSESARKVSGRALIWKVGLEPEFCSFSFQGGGSKDTGF